MKRADGSRHESQGVIPALLWMLETSLLVCLRV